MKEREKEEREESAPRSRTMRETHFHVPVHVETKTKSRGGGGGTGGQGGRVYGGRRKVDKEGKVVDVGSAACKRENGETVKHMVAGDRKRGRERGWIGEEET